jgi:hypothetical protein
MIVEIALHHAPQPSPNFRQRLMHSLPKLHLHLFQLGEESLSVGFAQHKELAVLPTLSTNVREPKELECLRLALTPSLPTLDREPPKLDQAGLVRVEFQTELLQAFLPFLEKSLRVTAMLEPQHHIVRVTVHNHIACGPVRPPVLYPKVEEVGRDEP